ncbi:PREDICTED: transcription factor PIF6 isoform X1 [Tarenaya hassleriana]|uniref:transcription factor PIF6 isoform X1 n=1 Tax=Tarenaya hassleriana TaxID=28532 RepID=UPI00053C5FF4|nr:PREDICTED: transcription factor PIF6 isoform X1 [Tarenaya hassleriana]XP_010523871.1 PREDICTED: transcription factor PIF6 isoform X1 [Tarenaya hassleriana]
MEEEVHFAPKMISTPLSNFKPKLEDHDYVELVWENGQILTRGGRRSNVFNRRTTSLLDLYEAEYYDVLKQNTAYVSNMNLGDPKLPKNQISDAKSPFSGGVFPEESDKPTKEKIQSSTLFKRQAVEVADDKENAAIEVEPKTEPGLPDHEAVLENEKDRHGSKKGKGVEPMMMVEAGSGVGAMANDMMNRKSLKKESLEFSPPDAQSVAMGRSLDTVGIENEETESSNLHGWSTELCSASLSVYSRGTMEDHIASSVNRTYSESDGLLTYFSSDLDHESDDVEEEVPARTRKTAKRKPSEDFDELSERETRHEIKKKMRDLRNLLPNCNKDDDKASLLDEAIKYMRTLQFQMQFGFMSLANSFAPPNMMLPLGHYSPTVGLGIGTPPFVPPPVPGAAFLLQPGVMPTSYSKFFDPIESSQQFQRFASMPSSDDSEESSNQGTVDGASAQLQMPEFSQVKNENQEMAKHGNDGAPVYSGRRAV